MSKDIAVQGTKAVSTEVDFLDQFAGAGFENISQEDLKQPFLKIAHKPIMSEDGRSVLVPAGNFTHSLTNEDLTNSVNVVVLKTEKAWVEWEPEGGPFVGKYSEADAKEKGKFHHQDDEGIRWYTAEGNTLNYTWYYYVLLADRPELGIMAFTLKTTGLKHSRVWNTRRNALQLPSGKKAPIFGAIWGLKTALNENAKNQPYFQIGKGKDTYVTKTGWVSREFFQNVVQPALELVKNANFVDTEHDPVPVDAEDAEWSVKSPQ